MAKKRVLWLSDFACSTGFARVAENIMAELLKTNEYEFVVIGINHHGEPYDYDKWPFPIYPAIYAEKALHDGKYQDVFGRQRLIDFLSTGEFDILFTLQDTFIIEQVASVITSVRETLIDTKKKPFKWIFYYPVDGKLKENWITNSAGLADLPVSYTEFARRESAVWGCEPKIIYHGVNTKDFYPMDKEDIKKFKKEFFVDRAADKFIVTNVNRNQRRKDIPRTIEIFKKFHDLRPNSLLYLHMNHNDVGGNILEMARYFGLEYLRDFVIPDNFNEQRGYPIEILNSIYNVSDVVMSTTLGEGWGLSSTEAMAVKTPIIFPNNTSLTEIIGADRGYLAECGKDMVCLGAEDMNQFRPLTDVDSMVKGLLQIYDNYPEAMRRAEIAYSWVQGLSWDKICKQWIEVFKEAEIPYIPKKTVGRNELCPCGSGKKYKKCCGK